MLLHENFSLANLANSGHRTLHCASPPPDVCQKMTRTSSLVFQVIFVLLGFSLVKGREDVEETSPEARDRMERLLNVFTIVKFPNDACNATGGNYYGTCYTATECTALGRIPGLIPKQQTSFQFSY